jgi:hypothetical protein
MSAIEEQIQQVETDAAAVKTAVEAKTATVSGLITEMRDGEIKRALDLLHRNAEEIARTNAPAGRVFKEFEKGSDGHFDYSKPKYEWSAGRVAIVAGEVAVTLGVVVLGGYVGGKMAQPEQLDSLGPETSLPANGSELSDDF